MTQKVCTYHKMQINNVDDDLNHMGPNCVIVEQGGDLGGVVPIRGNDPVSSGPFDDNAGYDMGTILPYETMAERNARIKSQGIPITEPPKST